jgi:hypothetical protein
VTGAACGIAELLIPIAPQDAHGAVPFIAVATVISSFGVVVYNLTQVSMRQAITPERLQGRMNSVIRFIVWGVMPLGQLTGGAIASAVDLRTALDRRGGRRDRVAPRHDRSGSHAPRGTARRRGRSGADRGDGERSAAPGTDTTARKAVGPGARGGIRSAARWRGG